MLHRHDVINGVTFHNGDVTNEPGNKAKKSVRTIKNIWN